MDVDGRTMHSSARWVDEARGFLDRRAARDDARPFLAWVAFHEDVAPVIRRLVPALQRWMPVTEDPLPPQSVEGPPSRG